MLKRSEITNVLFNAECLSKMQEFESSCINILYTDTPYNLGSEYIIDKQTGMYKFAKKGSDFLDKWEAMDGVFWQKYFEQAYRILKHGGFVVIHNIDRHSDLWIYYARKAGFKIHQKLYWMFLSNFPKGVDAAYQIDKSMGIKRPAMQKVHISQAKMSNIDASYRGSDFVMEKTEPVSKEAKLYDGYKYGIAPLKQVLEEILVFSKPPKHSIIRDLLEFERIPHEKRLESTYHPQVLNLKNSPGFEVKGIKSSSASKWKPNLIMDKKILQSSVLNKFGSDLSARTADTVQVMDTDEVEQVHALTSAPLFESDERVVFEPKIGSEEKDAGLEGFEVKKRLTYHDGVNNADGKSKFESQSKNPHPTIKPIKLAKWVLSLFMLPDPKDMLVLDTFMGQGSIPKACAELGINYVGIELNPEFYKIAQAKLKSVNQYDLFSDPIIINDQPSLF